MPRAIEFPDPVDRLVGERLRAFRLAREMSQTDLGAAMGLSFQQIQKYERGTNRISASMLVRASKALKAPVASFFPPDDLDPDATATGKRVAGSMDSQLAECIARMTSAQRELLLQVAREFVRQRK